jgi:rhodanese-related sulfurtransferase
VEALDAPAKAKAPPRKPQLPADVQELRKELEESRKAADRAEKERDSLREQLTAARAEIAAREIVVADVRLELSQAKSELTRASAEVARLTAAGEGRALSEARRLGDENRSLSERLRTAVEDRSALRGSSPRRSGRQRAPVPAPRTRDAAQRGGALTFLIPIFTREFTTRSSVGPADAAAFDKVSVARLASRVLRAIAPKGSGYYRIRTATDAADLPARLQHGRDPLLIDREIRSVHPSSEDPGRNRCPIAAEARRAQPRCFVDLTRRSCKGAHRRKRAHPDERASRPARRAPEGRQVVTVCQKGMRSFNAAGWLRQIGRNAFSLQGGMDQWMALGLPVSR